MRGEVSVVVVDFPEQALSLDLDRTKVVLAVRIVVLVEGVELRDSVQDCKLAGLAKRDHANGHNQHTAGKGLVQMIV